VTFLELCRAAANDSGTIAGVPSFTTTVGATGRVAQLVEWIRQAWIDIQNERRDWLWMRKQFTAALTINKRDYTAAELGLTDLGSFWPDSRDEGRSMSLYDPATGQADEASIQQVGWGRYRSRYDFGSHDAQRPSEWAFANSKLWLGPKPDKAYVLRGEYRRKAQRLLLDGDTPEMPEDYHMLIVAEAIRLMARSDEAWPVITAQTDQYMRLRYPLVRDQTPEVSFAADPLA
jgi:hypothetical protein